MDALVGDEVKRKTGASELQSDALPQNSAVFATLLLIRCVVGPQGFEPWTFGLKGRTSANRLHQDFIKNACCDRAGAGRWWWVDRAFCTEVGVFLLEVNQHNGQLHRAKRFAGLALEIAGAAPVRCRWIFAIARCLAAGPVAGKWQGFARTKRHAVVRLWQRAGSADGVRRDVFMTDMDARAGQGSQDRGSSCGAARPRGGAAAFH